MDLINGEEMLDQIKNKGYLVIGSLDATGGAPAMSKVLNKGKANEELSGFFLNMSKAIPAMIFGEYSSRVVDPSSGVVLKEGNMQYFQTSTDGRFQQTRDGLCDICTHAPTITLDRQILEGADFCSPFSTAIVGCIALKDDMSGNTGTTLIEQLIQFSNFNGKCVLTTAANCTASTFVERIIAKYGSQITNLSHDKKSKEPGKGMIYITDNNYLAARAAFKPDEVLLITASESDGRELMLSDFIAPFVDNAKKTTKLKLAINLAYSAMAGASSIGIKSSGVETYVAQSDMESILLDGCKLDGTLRDGRVGNYYTLAGCHPQGGRAVIAQVGTLNEVHAKLDAEVGTSNTIGQPQTFGVTQYVNS